MPRVRHASRYAPGTLAKARQLGIAPHELAGWPDRFPADEHCLAQRRPRSLVPEGVRLLALAMVESVLLDLTRPQYKNVGTTEREPDTARTWLHRDTDAPLSAVWCEQVTGLCLDRLRQKYPPIGKDAYLWRNQE